MIGADNRGRLAMFLWSRAPFFLGQCGAGCAMHSDKCAYGKGVHDGMLQIQALCDTSQKRTGPPVQRWPKTSSTPQNIASLPAIVAPIISRDAAKELFVVSSAEHTAHSPTPLALICIRLI